MAKDEKGSKGGASLWGPLKTAPGDSLGAEKVSGVPGSKHPEDPLGLLKNAG